jgi:hypothetical protein
LADRRSKAPLVDRCIFWETSRPHVPLDYEHIWGKWLLQYVHSKENKHSLKSTAIGTPGTLHTSHTRPRAGDPLRSKVKIVCKTCNSGWMGGIQSAAKPLLIPLIEGRRTTLGSSAQKAIAAWCAMATMTGEYLSFDTTAIAITQSEKIGSAFTRHRQKPGKSGLGIIPEAKAFGIILSPIYAAKVSATLRMIRLPFPIHKRRPSSSAISLCMFLAAPGTLRWSLGGFGLLAR